MFCTECGKKLETNDELCPECKAKLDAEQTATVKEKVEFEQEQYQNATIQVYEQVTLQNEIEQPQPLSEEEKKAQKNFGSKKGVVGVVLSGIGTVLIVVSIIILAFMVLVIEEAVNQNVAIPAETLQMFSMLSLVSVIIAVVSLGLAIPALINGIIAVSTFNKRKKAGFIPPIKTLVLGIIAIVLSAEILINVIDVLSTASEILLVIGV